MRRSQKGCEAAAQRQMHGAELHACSSSAGCLKFHQTSFETLAVALSGKGPCQSASLATKTGTPSSPSGVMVGPLRQTASIGFLLCICRAVITLPVLKHAKLSQHTPVLQQTLC